MSYFEPKGTSLNIAANTQELRKLIIENPDLPLLVFVGEESYLEDGRHYWMCCSGCHAELGEFLDCGVTEDGGGSVFIDRDKLYDTVYDYYYEETDEYAEEMVHAYDPYWKKCIILYVDN